MDDDTFKILLLVKKIFVSECINKQPTIYLIQIVISDIALLSSKCV